MSASDFAAFAEAVSTQRTGAGVVSPMRLQRVTVLGGGADARLLAALCLAEGAEVTLFSAYGKELDALRSAGSVTLRGEGPIGSFAVDREDAPSIRVTAELDRAVEQADAIFLTGPVHKQRTYAMVLADHLHDGQVLVLAPGRTLGAAETAWLLRVGGCTADITLVEAQGLPYWYVVSGGTLTLSALAPVSAATLPAGRDEVLEALARYLPNLVAATNILHSGFADGCGLVELPALLLGGPAVGDGLPALPVGAVALPEKRTFRSLLGASHEAVIAALAEERTNVARAFGVRDLPSIDDWLTVHAGSGGQQGTRAVPSQRDAQAIVRCAAIGSLAPLSSAAQVAGRAVPATDAMLALASTVLGADIASAGRGLDRIGIDASSLDDARRALERIAGGSSSSARPAREVSR